VRVQTGDTMQPFFFLHGDYSGGGFYCISLARQLGSEQPFYALHPHGMHGDRIPFSVEAMAAALLRPLRAAQPYGPYLLGGYCAAGHIALEMARQLLAAGERVDLVVLVDTARPPLRPRLARAAIGWYGRLAGLGADEQVAIYLRLRHSHALLTRSLRSTQPGLRLSETRLPRIRAAFQLLRAGLADPRVVSPGDMPGDAPSAQGAELAGRYAWAISGYRPEPYPGRVALFWSQDEVSPDRADTSMGWRRLVHDLEINFTPGTHLTSVTRHAGALAKQLRASLSRAQEAASRMHPPGLGGTQSA
jgi:thioesterase superfamily protein